MNKLLALFLSLSIWTTALAQGDPPPYVKGQSASGLGNLGSTIQVPKNQSTKLNSYQARIETGNTNELRNPSFEGSPYNSGWTCPTGTISQAVGPDGFKALGIVSSGAGFECNQTFTSTAELKGTLARFFARVKTSAPNTFVCGLDGGSAAGNRVNCQKVSLTSAEKVFSETSGFFNYGNMVYGIAIYSTDTAAFPTVIDDTLMGAAGLTTLPMEGDVIDLGYYTPTFGAGLGPVTGPTFRQTRIGNQLLIEFTLTAGAVTGSPATFTLPAGLTADILQGVRVGSWSGQGTLVSGALRLDLASPTIVQFGAANWAVTATGTQIGTGSTVSGFIQVPIVGWKTISSMGILSSNADTSWAPCTFSTLAWQGLGTVTNNLKCKRLGDSIKMRGYLTAGATTASVIQVPLPNNFGSLAVGSTIDTATSFGSFFRNVTGADVFYNTVATAGASYFGMSSALINAGSNPAVAAGGTSVAGSGNILTIDGELTIPIAGWTQSPIAIIPLAETVKNPGYTGQTDYLKVSYGATMSTSCVSGTCAYLDVAGLASSVISVARTGSGAYTYTQSRTCTKMKITGSASSSATSFLGLSPAQCSNCNSLAFTTGHSSSTVDSYGTLDVTCTY